MSPPEPWSAERAAAIVRAGAGREGPLLPILHAIQACFGCVPPQAVPIVAEGLNRSRAEIHGVISFYHDFRAEPAGGRVVRLCLAEACQARGLAAVRARLAAEGVETEAVYCLGLCGSGPAALVEGRPFAALDGAGMGRLLEAVRARPITTLPRKGEGSSA